MGSTLLSEKDVLEYQQSLQGGDAEAAVDGAAAVEGAGTEASCGSCYGAGEEGECCDTCDDVQRAYKRKGWILKDKENVEQCKHAQEDQTGEGCNIHGVVALSTGGGNLHIAPGKNADEETKINILDLLLQSMQEWNVSHTVQKIRFGPYYPAATYQLDGVTRNIGDTYGMYQYYFQASQL